MDRISSQPRDRRQAVLLSLLGLLGPGLAAPAALGAVIEGGQVGSIGPAETVNHSFDQSFDRTPFVFTMPTTEGQAPRSVRVDQVTRDGFTIRQTEPTEVAAADDPAAMTNVPYLAIEPGQHELATAGGTPVRIEAFNHRTTSTVLSNSGNHDAIELRHQGFGEAPVVLGQIQTSANEAGNPPGDPSKPWMTVSIKNVQVDGDPNGTGDGFDLALERSEASDGETVTQNERIAYLAIEVGARDVEDKAGDHVALVAQRTNREIDGYANGSARSIAFSDAFDATPIALATNNSRFGPNGGWLRRAGLSPAAIELLVDEDTVNDDERSHTTEIASILAFARAFRAEPATIGRALVWQGNDPSWRDTSNWDQWDGDPFNLVTGDTVIFNDTGSAESTTTLNAVHEARLSELRFAGDTAYTIEPGTGDAGGTGRLAFQNEATIDNRTDETQTIQSPIQGFGQSLNVDTGAAGGTLVFTADADINMADNGTVDVAGLSTARINGEVTGSITNRARLAGTGTWGDGDDHIVHKRGAVFAPGTSINTTTIDGDLTHEPGSTLAIEVDAQVDPISAGNSHDHVEVTGSATLDKGSFIDVDVENPAELDEGDRFTIIDAEGGASEKGVVISDSYDRVRFIVPGSFSNGDLSLPLVATYDVFSPRARGVNNNAVARGLASIAALKPTGPMQDQLLVPMRHIAGDRRYNRALKQLNSTPYDALAEIDLNQTHHFMRSLGQHTMRMRQQQRPRSAGPHSLASQNVATGRSAGQSPALPMLASHQPSPGALKSAFVPRTSGANPSTRPAPANTRPGPAAPTEDTRVSAFGQPFAITENQQAEPGQPGYVARAQGGMIGIDYRRSPSLFAGMTFAASHTDTHFSNQRGNAQTDTFRLGPHISYTKDNWFIDGATTFAYHRYDTTRRITALNMTMTSEHTALEIASFGRIGFTKTVAGWRVTPLAGVRHVYYRADSIDESAGPAALSIDRRDFHAISTRLAARITRPMRLGGVTVWPEMTVGWSHQWQSSDSLRTRFKNAGDPFTIHTDAGSDDTFSLGLGVSALLNQRTSAYARYQTTLTRNRESHHVTAGLQFRF